MLKLGVNFVNFTLLGQFVNSTKVHCADELFWERVRALNYFGCQIYLCLVKQRKCVYKIGPNHIFQYF